MTESQRTTPAFSHKPLTDQPLTGRKCGKPKCRNAAEFELWPSNVVYEFVDACTAHVGELIDDAPETRVVPLRGLVTAQS